MVNRTSFGTRKKFFFWFFFSCRGLRQNSCFTAANLTDSQLLSRSMYWIFCAERLGPPSPHAYACPSSVTVFMLVSPSPAWSPPPVIVSLSKLPRDRNSPALSPTRSRHNVLSRAPVPVPRVSHLRSRCSLHASVFRLLIPAASPLVCAWPPSLRQSAHPPRLSVHPRTSQANSQL